MPLAALTEVLLLGGVNEGKPIEFGSMVDGTNCESKTPLA